MVFGAIRSIIRPVSRALINARTTSSTPLYNNELHSHFGSIHQSHLFWRPASARLIQTLTDTRFPKRRPLDKPRRKRATLKPSGHFSTFYTLRIIIVFARYNWIINLICSSFCLRS
ncbi:hypothetical protein HanPI659440_Chr07g0259841 [Helianthus annuus]|nr:hypothetical protein HanPI659440_Chr07g0259841 [Helianthus annuus]